MYTLANPNTLCARKLWNTDYVIIMSLSYTLSLEVNKYYNTQVLDGQQADWFTQSTGNVCIVHCTSLNCANHIYSSCRKQPAYLTSNLKTFSQLYIIAGIIMESQINPYQYWTKGTEMSARPEDFSDVRFSVLCQNLILCSQVIYIHIYFTNYIYTYIQLRTFPPFVYVIQNKNFLTHIKDWYSYCYVWH